MIGMLYICFCDDDICMFLSELCYEKRDQAGLCKSDLIICGQWGICKLSGRRNRVKQKRIKLAGTIDFISGQIAPKGILGLDEIGRNVTELLDSNGYYDFLVILASYRDSRGSSGQ